METGNEEEPGVPGTGFTRFSNLNSLSWFPTPCYNKLLLFYNFLHILAGKKPQEEDRNLYSFCLFTERKTEQVPLSGQ